VSAQRDQRLGHREVLAAAQVTHGLDAERGRQVLGVPVARRFRGNGFSYRCEFAGLSATVLPVLNLNQLVMPGSATRTSATTSPSRRGRR
jgi:hypothetical protein